LYYEWKVGMKLKLALTSFSSLDEKCLTKSFEKEMVVEENI
jgi:hypothetical protein